MISRRELVEGAVASASLALNGGSAFGTTFKAFPVAAPPLPSITEAGQSLRGGKATARDLTELCLDRSFKLNARLNAFITIDAEGARQAADSLDAEARRGHWRGPLHGIPISLKDNIDTAGLLTTAGSQIYGDRHPDRDAEVVRRLKVAGAIILAKANLHEFAGGPTSTASAYGPVRNPWNLDFSAGGSSGGSGASVAARMCFASVGTDTGGSVRNPASFCGVVGMKPSYGRVPIRGIVPVISSQDCCGVIAASVRDATIMLDIMAGYDPYDATSAQFETAAIALEDSDAIKTYRVGIAPSPYLDDVDANNLKLFEEAVRVVSRLVSHVGPAAFPEPQSFSDIDLSAERYATYHTMFSDSPEKFTAFNQVSLGRLKAKFEGANAGQAIADYVESKDRLQLARRAIATCFANIDLIVLPSMRIKPWTITEACRLDASAGPYASHGYSNGAVFSLYGLPAISIPCGLAPGGFPVGLTIAGPRGAESRVLTLAHAFEQQTQWARMMPNIM
ncbi:MULTISPECIES: amidase [unclassified Sphingobium]|uniref:amidase n=1 Tax=unclassified Sphingobium TaxID=2611147 RepID=UPI000D177A9A|nr:MULTISPECIES: amidase [unclassified Sphingobium]MBG6116363.1 aspartyl-tRNA(Asn)/glutamyl-tRNA(Gln) amidotransferase subunit A [Sphingobium sp. JAI105]PSO09799.1 Asp-tRNA(Asn)/Glu-tRNA(Gln) amidotransferase GatCAB subunit A [Sphingobium sp. AEW4]TWC96956.1 aspartyl-tRNA(Asn)/glutamyl-tRNA(Gln) amidotransferase subunit A [Sphingobium sp. AEW010]TWD16482.1 aspartyl-tRNA(Asn)/glutamyl-tRNA(Gln) amidotransferase subunit A [Sphingobium sp. AEW013]TWD19880.1 aspartyl-tRNA(Asn)/glutamyl-tRNA(Gln) a